jgi:hypothetical protein
MYPPMVLPSWDRDQKNVLFEIVEGIERRMNTSMKFAATVLFFLSLAASLKSVGDGRVLRFR